MAREKKMSLLFDMSVEDVTAAQLLVKTIGRTPKESVVPSQRTPFREMIELHNEKKSILFGAGVLGGFLEYIELMAGASIIVSHHNGWSVLMTIMLLSGLLIWGLTTHMLAPNRKALRDIVRGLRTQSAVGKDLT